MPDAPLPSIGRRTGMPRGAGTTASAAPVSRSDQDEVAPDSEGPGPELGHEWDRARCARIVRMTAGSCSVAIRRRRPPQWAQAKTSMANAGDAGQPDHVVYEQVEPTRPKWPTRVAVTRRACASRSDASSSALRSLSCTLRSSSGCTAAPPSRPPMGRDTDEAARRRYSD